ncbi:MAG: phosphatidylglycerol lysyltransferase domain-containing protein [Elusimicrobia bacterium]|nr:phosphatidylglycerol lysyltransferase domain-containing protein [Elusimicrobiota bacterium]
MNALSLTKLKTSDFVRFEKFFKKNKYNLCEYSLSSIIFWDNCINDIFYNTDGDKLFIAEVGIENPLKKRLLLPMTIPFKFLSPEELSDCAKKLSFHYYYYAPQDYLNNAKIEKIEKYFNIYEQAGYADYIYKISDLAFLEGRKYSKKRNLIKQFVKKNSKTVQIAPLENSSLKDIMDMFDRWKNRQDIKIAEETLECEKKAVQNSLENFKLLKMRGIQIFIDGSLIAFAMGSELNETTFCLNFQKALPDMTGLYQFLDNEFAKIIPQKYIYLNKENDLGKEGLKKAKLSYYPTEIIKSYILEVK